MIYWFWVHVLLSDFMVKDALSFFSPLFPLSFQLCNGRPPLSRSRRLSFPSSRSPSVGSSLCHRRTPASVPTLASLTVSMARRRVVGRRRWTSTATRCTSATILMRRYRLHGAVLLSSYRECMWEWIVGWFMVDFPLWAQSLDVSFTLIRQSYNTSAWQQLPPPQKRGKYQTVFWQAVLRYSLIVADSTKH